MIPINWDDARLLCDDRDWSATHDAFWKITKTSVDFYMYDDKPMSVVLMNKQFEMSIGIRLFQGGPSNKASAVLEKLGFPWETRLDRCWLYLDVEA